MTYFPSEESVPITPDELREARRYLICAHSNGFGKRISQESERLRKLVEALLGTEDEKPMEEQRLSAEDANSLHRIMDMVDQENPDFHIRHAKNNNNNEMEDFYDDLYLA